MSNAPAAPAVITLPRYALGVAGPTNPDVYLLPTADAPCPLCGGPTTPPQHFRGEVGHYCEPCGRTHRAADGRMYYL